MEHDDEMNDTIDLTLEGPRAAQEARRSVWPNSKPSECA
jgi:hypothetical protein